MAGGTKRDYDGNVRAKSVQDLPRGRFHAMFETFRDELDEHYDRRERIIKASRDVTAQSKKMFVEFRLTNGPSDRSVLIMILNTVFSHCKGTSS